MIIGVLGKGGVGKSTLSTQIALFLATHNNVLAIDGDHNIDFIYNLNRGSLPEMMYLGNAKQELFEYLGIASDVQYKKIDLNSIEKRFCFTIDKIDDFTGQYISKISDRLYALAAGPQNDDVLYGKACSHSLSAPLKIYLPLLELSENEYVVLDEKAGADGASTGVVTGVDVCVIVTDASLHGTKTARQISKLLDFYQVPYVFVLNKALDAEDVDFAKKELGLEDILCFESTKEVMRRPGVLIEDWQEKLGSLVVNLKDIQTKNMLTRLERSIEKFKKQVAYGVEN